MVWIMVDVEADGPCPGLYSMVSFGAVKIDFEVIKSGVEKASRFYSGVLCPLENASYLEKAISKSGSTREDMLQGIDPKIAMVRFEEWLNKEVKGKPMFISDNNGFDWQFINYYFWKFQNGNPFGHSSTNLGSLYKGLTKTMTRNFKYLRKTKHTHHPVDDALGNCEALVHMIQKMGLYMPMD